MPKSKKPRAGLSPEEIARLDKQAEKKRLQREAKKLKDAADMPASDKWMLVHAQWEKNLARLPEIERKKVLDHVADWDYLIHAMLSDCSRIRDHVEYNTVNKDGEVPFCPEQLLAEVEEFARKYPPTDGVSAYDRFDYKDAGCLNSLSEMPLYLREYGYKVDSIGHITYFDFLHCFREWYKQHRNSLVLDTENEYGPEYCRTWEQIDELMSQNKDLAWIVGYKPPEPKVDPPPPPVLAPRFEPQPLSSAPQPRFGGWFESTTKNWPRTE